MYKLFFKVECFLLTINAKPMQKKLTKHRKKEKEKREKLIEVAKISLYSAEKPVVKSRIWNALADRFELEPASIRNIVFEATKSDTKFEKWWNDNNERKSKPNN